MAQAVNLRRSAPRGVLMNDQEHLARRGEARVRAANFHTFA